MQNSIYDEYHNFVVNNKKQIMKSKMCTCIECKTTFPSRSVIKFIYSDTTGICPQCESDLVVPSYFCVDPKKIEKWNKFLNEHNEMSDEHKNKRRKT